MEGIKEVQGKRERRRPPGGRRGGEVRTLIPIPFEVRRKAVQLHLHFDSVFAARRQSGKSIPQH
jgi:hypothetical protein